MSSIGYCIVAALGDPLTHVLANYGPRMLDDYIQRLTLVEHALGRQVRPGWAHAGRAMVLAADPERDIDEVDRSPLAFTGWLVAEMPTDEECDELARVVRSLAPGSPRIIAVHSTRGHVWDGDPHDPSVMDGVIREMLADEPSTWALPRATGPVPTWSQIARAWIGGDDAGTQALLHRASSEYSEGGMDLIRRSLRIGNAVAAT